MWAYTMQQEGDDEAKRRLRANREKKVQLFTLALGFLVASGALGGLFVGLWLNGLGQMGGNPLLPLVLSMIGLAVALVVAYRLTKRLLVERML
jgi:hypothetical protein